MLTNSCVTTMLPVKDLTRARQFYEGKLGLKPIGLKPDGKFTYECSGATLALFPKDGGTKADHTAISFQVPDIAASIAELERAGVVFEDYDFPASRLLSMSACSAQKRQRGSSTPKATSCVCMKTLPELTRRLMRMCAGRGEMRPRGLTSQWASRIRHPCRCSPANAA
jgi:predicted enzyme related to lactoylglutathione lyase